MYNIHVYFTIYRWLIVFEWLVFMSMIVFMSEEWDSFSWSASFDPPTLASQVHGTKAVDYHVYVINFDAFL